MTPPNRGARTRDTHRFGDLGMEVDDSYAVQDRPQPSVREQRPPRWLGRTRFSSSNRPRCDRRRRGYADRWGLSRYHRIRSIPACLGDHLAKGVHVGLILHNPSDVVLDLILQRRNGSTRLSTGNCSLASKRDCRTRERWQTYLAFGLKQEAVPRRDRPRRI